MEDLKIVPEYDSKNPLIKYLFFSRLKSALSLSDDFIIDEKESNVADFGCGDCLLLKNIEDKFKNIKTYGVDILPEILKYKKSLRADIKIADLKNTGFDADFFDAIFCLDTLEHFEDLSDPIGEISRVLRKDGILVVSLPTENLVYKLGRFFLKGTFSSKTGPSSSPHFHNASEIRKFLINNSFIIKKKEKVTKIPFLTFFEIILFEKN